MFKGLRDKLKGALSGISSALKKEDAVVEEPEEIVEKVEETPTPADEVEIEAPEDAQEELTEDEGDEQAVVDDEEDSETEDSQDVEKDESELEQNVQPAEDEGADTSAETQEEKEEPEETQEPESKTEPEQLVEEDAEEKTEEEPAQEAEPKKKGFFSRVFKKKDEGAEEKSEQDESAEDAEETEDLPPTKNVEETPVTPTKQQDTQQAEEKKGFFTKLSEKITTIQLSEEKFEELFWDLEIVLLENNVAVSVIEKIKEDLKEELTTGRTARGDVQERILRRLEESIREVLTQEPIDLLTESKEHKPYVVAAIGVNGSGKTTSLAKLAYYFKKQGKTVVLGACDTFRAAAIQQLEEHAKKIGVPLIKQEYGADPAAVAFDTIKHAKSKGIDVVLLDTAGRLHSNTNLMDELEKVIRVANPHRILFVGEAVTGNDCVEQAEKFGEKIRIDGIILTKADVDEKGGAAISISYVTKKPIVFMGTGQGYDDLSPFDAGTIVEKILP